MTVLTAGAERQKRKAISGICSAAMWRSWQMRCTRSQTSSLRRPAKYCSRKSPLGKTVSGALTGRITPETVFPSGDFREQYFAGRRKELVWDRVQRICQDLHIAAEQMPEIAL